MYEDGTPAPEGAADEQSLPRIQIPIWSIISYTLYFAVFALIAIPCILMWTAQPHDKEAIHSTEQETIKLQSRIAEAGNGPISFTEDELNLHFAQRCNMVQQGGYSIIAHPESVKIAIHDGYAEIIFDRMLGAEFHHTVAVNISFERQEDEDYSRVICHMHGGSPLFGGFQRGGAIGSMPIPERFMQMMIPPLKRLMRLHPQIQELIEERGYLPHFTFDNAGRGIVQFLPPSQQFLSTNN